MQKYHTHSKASIAEVFEAIAAQIPPNIKNGGTTKINGQIVGVSSVRLRTFHKTGAACHACGLEATHFELNRDSGGEARNAHYHLNLWGVNADGYPVLFTHDHKLARSLGGADNLTNTETMCSPCNAKKGKLEQKEALRLSKLEEAANPEAFAAKLKAKNAKKARAKARKAQRLLDTVTCL